MHISFKRLFQVQLRHTFYKDGRSVQDFSAHPSPATARVLQDYGLIFRPSSDGFSLYARVEPGTPPHHLLNSIGTDNLRLHFLLQPTNPYIQNVSALPGYQPGRSIFYFNNLRDDQQHQRLHLGDHVVNSRIGGPLHFVAGPVYTHRFLDVATSSPLLVSSATITIQDMFGNSVHTESFQYPDRAEYKTSEYRISLQAIPKLGPGRYVVNADQGKSQDIFYDPDLKFSRPFGVIEIFNRTDSLTPTQADIVPQDYRFLLGDQLTGLDPYQLQLDARSTTWRYTIMKKYDKSSIPLNQLSIVGDLSFNARVLDPPVNPTRAIFTTSGEEILQEIPRSLELHQNGTELRKLPNPQLSTALQKGSSSNNFVSELFVYV